MEMGHNRYDVLFRMVTFTLRLGLVPDPQPTSRFRESRQLIPRRSVPPWQHRHHRKATYHPRVPMCAEQKSTMNGRAFISHTTKVRSSRVPVPIRWLTDTLHRNIPTFRMHGNARNIVHRDRLGLRKHRRKRNKPVPL